MNFDPTEKINTLKFALEKIDIFSATFTNEIQKISELHKINGNHLEYVYVNHFNKELIGLSNLVKYLLKEKSQQKYCFFALRCCFEIFLYLEYVLKLANEDGSKILELLSKDMSQISAVLDAAKPIEKDHSINVTLNAVKSVNKILRTNFEFNKIKSNTKVFPSIKELCEKSSLNIKDLYGQDMYHLYVSYSESNHFRLGSMHTFNDDSDLITCWTLEYFIEIYIKFYQQLITTNKYSNRFSEELTSLKNVTGLNW